MIEKGFSTVLDTQRVGVARTESKPPLDAPRLPILGVSNPNTAI